MQEESNFYNAHYFEPLDPSTRAIVDLKEKHSDIIEVLERGIAFLKDLDRCQSVFDADLEKWFEAGGPDAAPGVAPCTLNASFRKFEEYARELVLVVNALVVGLPRTNACVCSRCKIITLMNPEGTFSCKKCKTSWINQGRYHQGLDFAFWKRYSYEDKFKGLTWSDDQEDLVKSIEGKPEEAGARRNPNSKTGKYNRRKK